MDHHLHTIVKDPDDSSPKIEGFSSKIEGFSSGSSQKDWAFVCDGKRAGRDWTFVCDGKKPIFLTGSNIAANDGFFPIPFDG